MPDNVPSNQTPAHASDDNGSGSERRVEPSPLRAPILVALLLATGAALLGQPRVVEAVRDGRLEVLWLLAAPLTFVLVVVLAAADSWRIARRRGYFRGPSVVMLAACVAFLGMLLPATFREYQARTSPRAEPARMEALAAHSDPRVRALVMDAAAWRPVPSEDVATLIERGLADKDPMVVQAAIGAVSHRAGVPLSGPEALSEAADIARAWTAD